MKIEIGRKYYCKKNGDIIKIVNLIKVDGLICFIIIDSDHYDYLTIKYFKNNFIDLVERRKEIIKEILC